MFAERYRAQSPYGDVDAIEVWNEPNLQREWGETDPPPECGEMLRMLKLTYAAVKSVDPSIQVVTGG